MARPGITFEQVSAAADEMIGEGRQPTIKSVREALGTGSSNTIHRHLSAWREARPAPVASALELPSELSTAIVSLIERTRAAARAEIEGRLVEAQAEAAELVTVGEALEVEIAGMREQVASLTAERDTVEGRLAQQATELREVAQRLEREQQAAEAARTELATALLKIEDKAESATAQAQTIERLRADLESQRNARINAEQQAAVLASQLEAVRDRQSAETARAEAATQAAETARAEAAQTRESAADLRGQIATAQVRAEAGERLAKQAREDLLQARTDIRELRQQLDAARSVPPVVEPSQSSEGQICTQ